MPLAMAIGRHSARVRRRSGRRCRASVSPRCTTWTLLKSAVWRLTSFASRSGSMNSLKLTVTRARTGRPSSRNRMNFWLARASTQRNCSEAQATRSTGGACSSRVDLAAGRRPSASRRARRVRCVGRCRRTAPSRACAGCRGRTAGCGELRPGIACDAKLLSLLRLYSSGLNITSNCSPGVLDGDPGLGERHALRPSPSARA